MNITIILIIGSTIMLLKRVLWLLTIMPLRLTKTEKNQQKNKREAAVMWWKTISVCNIQIT